MTGRELLEQARELAYHDEKHGRPGTATMLFDIINEIERLREAAKGSAVIVNQAQKMRAAAIDAQMKAEASVVTLSIDKGRLRKALIGLLDDYLDRIESDLGRETKMSDRPRAWRWAHAVWRETCQMEPAVADTSSMTFDQFHNAIRVLWNIDQPDWMEPEDAVSFLTNPHRFFVRADDETARKLWALIEPRLRS